MLRFVLRCPAVIMAGLLLSACSWMPWSGARRRAAAERELAAARRAPVAVGRVALVNEGERFALIEANLMQPPPTGTLLRIYAGETVAAELRATGVRRRPFLVADLVSGMPAKGDVVMQPPGAEAAPPAVAVAVATTPAPAPRPRGWLRFFRWWK